MQIHSVQGLKPTLLEILRTAKAVLFPGSPEGFARFGKRAYAALTRAKKFRPDAINSHLIKKLPP